MNYDEMEAGRGMDALVAEKVMGAKPCDKWIRFDTRSMVKFDECDHKSCFPPMEGPPHYSTNISAAWEVVEKMGTYRSSLLAGVHYWKFIRQGEIEGQGEALTAPLAICRAALKAVEEK